MNGEHASSDDPLRDLIEDALAVDPSADFVQRVRVRIAEEPRAAWWRPWRLACGALAAAGAVAFYVTWPASDLHVPRPPAATAAPRPAGGSGLLETPAAMDASLQPQAVGPQALRPARTPVAPPPQPVPSREAAGLRILVDNIRRGRVDTSEWLEQPTSAASPDDIVIRPIEIEPLSELALLSGERQW